MSDVINIRQLFHLNYKMPILEYIKLGSKFISVKKWENYFQRDQYTPIIAPESKNANTRKRQTMRKGQVRKKVGKLIPT